MTERVMCSTFSTFCLYHSYFFFLNDSPVSTSLKLQRHFGVFGSLYGAQTPSCAVDKNILA